MFQVIPAIDLQNGQCVRLRQGLATDSTVYSDDPVAMAKQFEEAGAQRLHLVDLDGAFEGDSANTEVIQKVVQALNIPVQVGGGFRTSEAIQKALDSGIRSVIIGTMAVKNEDALKAALSQHDSSSIILGVDARDEKVATHGWANVTELDAIDFIQHWEQHGISRVIFTDISRDGMLSGPNLPLLKKLAEHTNVAITASGGVSKAADLQDLKKLYDLGVDQVIVGKAIYEGTLRLDEAFSC